MTKIKNLNKGDVAQLLREAFKTHYYFGGTPSEGSFSVPAPGKYLPSFVVSSITGVPHQDVVDRVMASLPRSVSLDLIVVCDEHVDIHASLLPEFGIGFELVPDRGGLLQ